MSRAFIKEDAGDSDEWPERHQSASPNYVTRAGLEALRRRAEELKARLEGAPPDSAAAREARRDLRYFTGRIASAILVEHPPGPAAEARFGAIVELGRDDGSVFCVAIVGQDEAEGAPGKIAWDSPLALALMGAKEGDRIETPEGAVSVLKLSR